MWSNRRALTGANPFSVGCQPDTGFIVMVIVSQVNHIIRPRMKLGPYLLRISA
jgi:hypothetical protein